MRKNWPISRVLWTELNFEAGLQEQTTNWQLESEMAFVKVSLSDEPVVWRELEEKIVLLMNELEELKALVAGSMDTIGAQELNVRVSKYFDALADQLKSSCSPDQDECVHDLSSQLEQEKVQLMETLVNQQLFAIKDLQAALEEELEAATSCQEVDN